LFVVSRGLSLGRRAALVTVAGNSLGLTLQLVLVSVGVGSAIARSHTALAAVTLTGAAYLVLLGFRTIRARVSPAPLFRTENRTDKPTAQIVREGFIVGATNPKGLVIFAAVLPRFVDRGGGGIATQLLALGAICIVIALIADGTWALAAGAAGRWFASSQRRLEGFRIAGGAMLVALGVGLALAGALSSSWG
jgi:threonine/homoserine/homoserine lactone efflux protein